MSKLGNEHTKQFCALVVNNSRVYTKKHYRWYTELWPFVPLKNSCKMPKKSTNTILAATPFSYRQNDKLGDSRHQMLPTITLDLLSKVA